MSVVIDTLEQQIRDSLEYGETTIEEWQTAVNRVALSESEN